MRTFLLFFSTLLVAACDANVEQTGVIRPECAEPPATPVTTRSGEILRLDVVQLGERVGQTPSTAASLGMNVDGACSTDDETTFTCARHPGASRARHEDGDGGIDNSFGRVLVPLLAVLDERPSEAASGTSFLVLEGEGRATLHVGDRSGQIIFSVPLESVRLDEGRLDLLVELSAVIPTPKFRETLRARANALSSPPSLEFCGARTVETILGEIDMAQDVRLDLVPNRAEPCDGVSIGLRFRATPVTKMPELPPTCEEQRQADAEAGAGG